MLSNPIRVFFALTFFSLLTSAGEIDGVIRSFMSSGDLKYFNVTESVLYTCKPYLDQIPAARREAIVNAISGRAGQSEEFSKNVREKYELVSVDSQDESGLWGSSKIHLKRKTDGIAFPMTCRLLKSPDGWKIVAFEGDLTKEEAETFNKKTLNDFLTIEKAIGTENMPEFMQDVLVNGVQVSEAINKYRK